MKKIILSLIFFLLMICGIGNACERPTHVIVPKCLAFVNADEYERFIYLYLKSERDGHDYFITMYDTDRAAIVNHPLPVCIVGKKAIAERMFIYRVVSPAAHGSLWVPRKNLKRIKDKEA